jgi:RNA polymerase sigma factor (TIGR02999 family)
MASQPPEISTLIRRWSAGDLNARDQLIPFVYDRLREIAHRRLTDVPAEQSLNTTALVHEAYLRLASARQLELRDRTHFLALASQVMRMLLVDRVRARLAAKRGAGVAPAALEDLPWLSDAESEAVTDLDEALRRLSALNPRQAQLLEYRYFGGLSLEESAATLGISLATVKRELRSARAWLALELSGERLADDG